MKKLLWCFMLLPLCCCAQPGAISFGVLKIGVTRLDSLEALIDAKISRYGDAHFDADHKLKELRLYTDSSMDKAMQQRMKNRIAKGYTIIELTECRAGTVELDHIELIFHKGILIGLLGAINNELVKWCEDKYGKAVDDSKYDTITCREYYNGKDAQHVNKETDYIWRRGNEQARFYMKNKYDADCREQLTSWFLMEDMDEIVRYKELMGNDQ